MGDNMKIWPLLILSMIPFQAYAMVDLGNDSQGEDGSFGESDDDEEDDEDFEGFYGDEDFVSISTGTSKSLAKAPAVASVITAKDIKQMGATSLSEVLAKVPGLHVSNSSQLYAPKFIIRGITSNFNPQTLVLVNGVPISSVVRGDRGTSWGKFGLGSVARIEVIRGPGSALHGADAYAGVVNIITKTFEDIDKPEVGIRTGSFDTSEIWGRTSFELAEAKIALSAEYSKTDGHDGIITSDGQTALDDLGLSPVASFAPGPVNVGYNYFDVRLDVAYKDVSLKVGFQDVDDLGTGQGVLQAVDPHGKFGSEKLLVNLGYKQAVSETMHFDHNISYYRTNQRVEENIWLLPPGTFFGAFPNGIIGNPEIFERTVVAKTQAVYTGWLKNSVSFGLGYRNQDLYRVEEAKNFQADLSPYPAGVTEVTDTVDVFMPEAERDNYFAYVQNEYQMAPDWDLTAGVRYDKYSDFGSTINPRLAIVWQTNSNLSTKFLYGRAFRAPGSAELTVQNNPAQLGNSAVKPETIDTFETAFNYQASQKIHIDFNLYLFKIDDSISFVPDANASTSTAQNVGKLKGYGVEGEVTFKVSDDVSWLFNYAYQKTKDQQVDDDLGGAPASQLYSQLNWKISESVNLNTRVSYIGSQERNSVDPRDPVDAYTSVSFTLNYSGILEGMDLQFKVNNLFDEDIREPSDGPSRSNPAISIADDLPQAGRNMYLGLTKTF
jgi:outer membrane receptor for ferrienterochelin and colicin